MRDVTESIEHQPWVGDNYQTAIANQRIALVRHSHWRDVTCSEDIDSNDYTLKVISDVLESKVRPFFPQFGDTLACR